MFQHLQKIQGKFIGKCEPNFSNFLIKMQKKCKANLLAIMNRNFYIFQFSIVTNLKKMQGKFVRNYEP